MNMKELWDTARMYGRVSLYTTDRGHYTCRIEFNTIDHVSLEAKSQYGVPTPEKALTGAIESAKKIVDSMEQQVEKMKRLR